MSRKFSVGLTMPVLYRNSNDASVPKVSPTACITMPGYWASKIAEIAPRNKPSAMAYKGAVVPDHCFLNMVTEAYIKPTIAPPIARGITVARVPVEKYSDYV